MSRPKKSEQSIILSIRVPGSWHNDLLKLAMASGEDMSVLLRPYIRYGINDLKMKATNNQILKGE
jgi:hypothetical protein